MILWKQPLFQKFGRTGSMKNQSKMAVFTKIIGWQVAGIYIYIPATCQPMNIWFSRLPNCHFLNRESRYLCLTIRVHNRSFLPPCWPLRLVGFPGFWQYINLLIISALCGRFMILLLRKQVFQKPPKACKSMIYALFLLFFSPVLSGNFHQVGC